MNALRWRALTVLLCAALTAAAAHLMTPRIHLADRLGKPDLEALFPKQFGSWRLDERSGIIMPSPDTQAILDSIYNQTLTRTYIDAQGYRVMLSVAYGGDQSDSTRAHLPEGCYPAQGFQITHNQTTELELAQRPVSSRLLMARMGNREEPITYWLVVGDQVSNTRTEQKLTQLRLGLQGLIPDGMLVRVSSIDANMAHGHQQQARFLRDLAAAIPESDRSRVFGARGDSLQVLH